MNFNWLNPKLTTANYASSRSVFAAQPCERGELLAVFWGCVMTMEQFAQLPPEVQRYPYQVNDDPVLLFGPMKTEDISDGDFFDHSCDPNAGFRGTMHLVAMRAIPAREQITFDYATCMTGTFGDMDCYCGAADCRKHITGEDWQIPLLQLKYAGYWQPYIQEKINRRPFPSRTGTRLK